MVNRTLPASASARCARSFSSLVPVERGEDQRGESPEGRERGHLQIADHLVGEGEHARHDDRGANGPHGRGG
jgi:hypothetical protein